MDLQGQTGWPDRTRWARRWSGIAIAGALLLLASVALAQDSSTADDSPPPKTEEIPPEIRSELESPFSTLNFFLDTAGEGEFQLAAYCLNLSAYTPDTANTKGPEFASNLYRTIIRLGVLDRYLLPSEPDYDRTYALANALDTSITGPAVEEANEDAERLVLARGSDDLWRFTPATVAAIDEMWMRWEGRPIVSVDAEVAAEGEKLLFSEWLRQQFPASLRERSFLIPDYQWICLAALVVIGCVADVVFGWVMIRLTNLYLGVDLTASAVRAERNIWRPLGLLVQALIWYWGIQLLQLPAMALSFLFIALKMFAGIAFVWSAFRLIDLFSSRMAERARKTGTGYDDLLVPLLGATLKIGAVIVAMLVLAGAFGIQTFGLLGGLGIGGAALALASQDAISNLFGSFTVVVDRPFEIGDWVIVGDVEGTVETVGLRSTRIRTFYNSVVTVPNSQLTTSFVDNMGRRTYRRVKTHLLIRYETPPDLVEAFCEGIREIIRRHPYTRKDFYHVYFNDFGESGLNILLYCFIRCNDWGVELRERQRLLLDIMRLAGTLNIEFAFPTQTVHLHRDAALPNYEAKVDNPQHAAKRLAADIAGDLLSPDERPGPVVFPGPTRFEESESEPGR